MKDTEDIRPRPRSGLKHKLPWFCGHCERAVDQRGMWHTEQTVRGPKKHIKLKDGSHACAKGRWKTWRTR